MSLENDGIAPVPQNIDTETDGAVSTEDLVLGRIQQVTSYVETLIASWNGPTTVVERRRWHRIPYRRSILITPLDDETLKPSGPSQMMPGRDISLGGVSFEHREPLASRKVACTFDPSSGCGESVVVRLTWCRFTKDGWYQSGGQFVQSIALNLDRGSSGDSDESSEE